MPTVKTNASKAGTKKAGQADKATLEVPGWRAAMELANKQYGPGSVQLMGNMPVTDIPVFSTGFLSLDMALGRGMARGKIVEMFGPESSGKTTLALHMLAAVQRAYPDTPCAYIDAEHVLNPDWARTLGVDWDALLFSQPSCGEEAIEILLLMVRIGAVPMAVVDSVAALTPRAELEGQVGASNVGAQARLMSQAMRMLAGSANKKGTTVIFINQIREKVGVLYGCLRGDVTVPFADGTCASMRQIVESRIAKEVWAMGPDGKIRPAMITNWFNNGKVAGQPGFLHIKADAVDVAGGYQQATVTPDHEVLTSEAGWVKARDLIPGQHTVLSRRTSTVDGGLEATTVPVAVRSVVPATARPGWLDKYDLEVAGSGNYMVGSPTSGFIVHNSPEVTPGGRALKFYSSIRMDIRRMSGEDGTFKIGDLQVGNKIRVKVVKNKTASPFRQTVLELYYETGISRGASLLTAAKALDVVQEDGAHQFHWAGNVLGKGAKVVAKALDADPALLRDLSRACTDVLLATPPAAAPAETVAENTEDEEDELSGTSPGPDSQVATDLASLQPATGADSNGTGGPEGPAQANSFVVRDFLLAHAGASFTELDLVAETGVELSTVIDTCERLEQAGLVVRPTDELVTWRPANQPR
jgi:RecA/RadA recombinase